MGTFYKGGNLSKEDICHNGNISCILYGELYTRYLNKIENVQSKTHYKENLVFSQKGDVILPLSGETPLDISNSAVIPSDRIALGSDLLALRTTLNPLFLSYEISGKRKKQIAKLAQGKTIVHSNPKSIMNLEIFYPSKEEQNEIINILDTLSRKIDIISNKLNALKKYKKGIVLKLLNPTINNWKNGSHFGSQLACFLEPYKALATDNEGLVHATLSKDGVSRKIDRYNRDFLVKNNDKKYKIVDKDDLIYNPSNLKFGVICINKYDKCIVSPIYETFKIKKISPALLEAIVTSKSFINYALKYEEGTVYERRSVSPDDLLKIKLVINQENEINFKKIFQLIYLKTSILERMLNQLEKHKKYLLNNMFI